MLIIKVKALPTGCIFFAIIKEEKLYLGHLYPKTGAKGQEVLSKKEENEVIKSLLSDVKSGTTKEVYLDITKNKICYSFNNDEVW